MEYEIIDAHAHLWLKQDTVVDGLQVKTIDRGRSLFLGEVRQMLPPFMIDGRNSAEAFIANMDYAQVCAAVITQEFIDGLQNEYLAEVKEVYPKRFRVCGMADVRQHGFLPEAQRLIEQGYDGITIPGHRLPTGDNRMALNDPELMQMYQLMQSHGTFLSLCLAPNDMQQIAEIDDIVAHFPDLKIAIGHFGMVTCPGWEEQIKLARHPNVMIESGGITWLFNDEFYPYPSAIRAIKRAADLVGIDKLMWGSDYPRTITAITYKMSYDFIVKSAELTDAEKSAFLGLNAKRFYGFHNLEIPPYIKNMSE